jgi:hypothetical protein
MVVSSGTFRPGCALEAAATCPRLEALKTKLGECQPSGLSSLRSDGSRDGQAGGMTTLVVAKDAGGESRKIILGSQGT